MAVFFIGIIIVCLTGLILHKKLLYMVAAVEDSCNKLEEALRVHINNDNDEVAELLEIYKASESVAEIEDSLIKYRECVTRYRELVSRQPWKSIAWLLQLTPSGPRV